MAISSLTIRPRRTAAVKQGKKLWVEPWVVWRDDGFRSLRCPACAQTSVMEKRLDASPPFEPRKRYALYECGACGTLHYPDAPVFEYESRKDADIARKFYVEVGAGLDAMIAPLAWADPDRVQSYLEVGGGYGFSVDFAARALGWRAANIDPSFIARTGAADLGHNHLPEYLSAENPLPNGPFDRVLSSEVIEHVPDPDPFLSALVSAVSKNGAVVVTTPDAGAVHADASDDTLRPIIVAGHHLVIFTANGLELALKRAGMTHVKVVARDQTLYAVASYTPIDVDFSAKSDRHVFRQYLRDRRDDLASDPTLHAGFAVRYLKECVHSGEWADAKGALGDLTTRWRKDYGFDLGAPDTIRPVFALPEKNWGRALREFAASQTYNLAIALFYAARLHENSGDRLLAEATYRACHRTAKTLGDVFEVMFAACRETEDVGRRAALHAALLAVRHNPEKASREVLAAAAQAPDLPPDLWEETQLRVYADGVLTGQGDAVEPLAVMVSAMLLKKTDLDHELTPTDGFAAGALGIRAEQSGHVPQAARWYDLATSAMDVESERDAFQARFDAMARIMAQADSPAMIEARFAEIESLEAEGRDFRAKQCAQRLLSSNDYDIATIRAVLGSRFATLERYNALAD